MWCTQVDVQEPMIHEKHAMNKSIVTQKSTKGTILERQSSLLQLFAPRGEKSDTVGVG